MKKTKGECLAEILENIRSKRICVYTENKHKCDCKYDANSIGFHGEHNGCPELRDAVKILRNLSDNQYNSFLEKRKARPNPELKKLEKKMEKLEKEKIEIEKSMFDLLKSMDEDKWRLYNGQSSINVCCSKLRR